MKKESVVLAYSGGLDTSIILHWLVYQKNLDVVAFTADIGQCMFDSTLVKKRAYLCGASKVVVKDLKEELVKDFAFKAINADAVYEDGYLLGTSIARPLIAKGQVQAAKEHGCNILAHGATGKGNDQIRFEFAYKSLYPKANILSPWKDAEFLKQFKSREDMIKYADMNKIDISSSSREYSIDDNILHISHEGGMLEDVNNSSYPILIKESEQNECLEIIVEFEKGIPTSLNIQGKKISDPVRMFQELNKLAELYKFGIVDIVENRYVGIKSRGVYYQGAMEIFYRSHVTLEATILDKKTFHKKLELGREIGKLIYEGRWYSNYLQNLFLFCEKVNDILDGQVKILIRPNAFNVIARRPKNIILYNKIRSTGSFSMLNFNPEDAKGFINIAHIEDTWNNSSE
ncbi:MAG: argininosuccinate synthase [Candidatus Micrarchaeota archaeon]|nr:argininosuccinate synthase [Candidatus Micrarchaeota archaeon]